MALGRALAAQSHELKNVLATVGEAAGLMEDLLALQRSRQPEGAMPEDMAARIDKALGSITAQVERGHRLTTDLNTVAHLPDRRLEKPQPELDLGVIMALACRLLERSARGAEVRFAPPQAVGVGVPADAHRCLAACLLLGEWLYRSFGAGETVPMAAVPDTPAVDIAGAPDAGSMPEEVRAVSMAAGLHFDSDANRLRVALMEV
jgi:signal transduction histidine kinase